MGWAARNSDVGASLQSFMRRTGQLEVGRALDIAHQLALSLRAAHETGRLHGALAPDCIVRRGPDEWVVCGYGRRATQPESHAYLAPDGWRPGQLTAACDVWALGAILFELLTGRLPFPSLERFDPKECLLVSTAPPVTQYCVAPEAVEALVAQCLSTRPEQRPSMTELVSWLERNRRLAARGSAALVMTRGPVTVATPTKPTGTRWRGFIQPVCLVLTGIVIGLLLREDVVSGLCRTVLP